MKDKSLISVLIPTYNVGCFIEECLHSVLNQTWTELEVIVVDDGSSDNTYQIAKSFEGDKRVKVYQQKHQGAPVARNLAFALSSGTYIQYLDGDDILSPQKLEKQVLSLQKCNESAISVVTFRQYKDGILNDEWFNLSKVNKNYDKGIDLQVALWKHEIPSYVPSCYLTHRSIIQLAGEWNERLIKNQDGEFFSRILKFVSEVVFIDKEYVGWRYVENSITHQRNKKSVDCILYTYKSIAHLLCEIKPKDYKIAIAVNFGRFIWYEALTYAQVKETLAFLQEIGITPMYPTKSRLFLCLNSIVGPFLGIRILSLKKHLWKKHL